MVQNVIEIRDKVRYNLGRSSDSQRVPRSVILRGLGLSRMEGLVFGTLFCMAESRDGVCSPSVPYLCNKFWISKPTTIKIIKHLKSLGILEVTKERHCVNSYKPVTMDELHELREKKIVQLQPREDEEKDKMYSYQLIPYPDLLRLRGLTYLDAELFGFLFYLSDSREAKSISRSYASLAYTHWTKESTIKSRLKKLEKKKLLVITPVLNHSRFNHYTPVPLESLKDHAIEEKKFLSMSISST